VSGQHLTRGAAALRQAVTLTPAPADPALPRPDSRRVGRPPCRPRRF
jgi:hypothetical protein